MTNKIFLYTFYLLSLGENFPKQLGLQGVYYFFIPPTFRVTNFLNSLVWKIAKNERLTLFSCQRWSQIKKLDPHNKQMQSIARNIRVSQVMGNTYLFWPESEIDLYQCTKDNIIRHSMVVDKDRQFLDVIQYLGAYSYAYSNIKVT